MIVVVSGTYRASQAAIPPEMTFVRQSWIPHVLTGLDEKCWINSRRVGQPSSSDARPGQFGRERISSRRSLGDGHVPVSLRRR